MIIVIQVGFMSAVTTTICDSFPDVEKKLIAKVFHFNVFFMMMMIMAPFDMWRKHNCKGFSFEGNSDDDDDGNVWWLVVLTSGKGPLQRSFQCDIRVNVFLMTIRWWQYDKDDMMMKVWWWQYDDADDNNILLCFFSSRFAVLLGCAWACPMSPLEDRFTLKTDKEREKDKETLRKKDKKTKRSPLEDRFWSPP